MELQNVNLKEEFKNYYNKTGNTATHVFVFSKIQLEIGQSFDFNKRKCTIKGEEYSEMRSRDSSNNFNHKDVKFVAVGCYIDVNTM